MKLFTLCSGLTLRTSYFVLCTLITALTAHCGGWSYGFDAGVGLQAPVGGAADLIKTTVNFGAGIEGGYAGLRLKVGFTYGQPTIRIDNPFGIIDENGRDLQLNKSRNLSNFAVSLMAGYRIKASDRVAVTPLAGAYYSRLSWTVNDIEWSKNEAGRDVFAVINATDVALGSWSWRAQADIDIKLHGQFVDKTRYTSSLRISPWVAGLRFHGGLPQAYRGTCLGLTVAYAGLFTTLR